MFKLRLLTKERKTSVLVLMVLAGFLVSAGYHLYANSQLPYPFNSFLFNPQDRYRDFTNWYYQSTSFNPYDIGSVKPQMRAIFPFLYLTGFLFSLIEYNWSFRIFIWGFTLLFFYITYTQIKTGNKTIDLINSIVLVFLSYPFLFNLDRANPEVMIFFALYYFLFYLQKQKFTLGALSLAQACALKPFPLIFMTLIMEKKRIREIFLTLGVITVLTVLPFFLFRGSMMEKLANFTASFKTYNRYYVLGYEGLSFGNSLYGLGKALAYIGPFNRPLVDNYFIPVFYKLYVAWSFLGLALIIVYLKFREKEFWKKVALLVFAMNALPTVSGDYKLIHIFLPLYLFLNKTEKDKHDPVYLILFGLLLIPKAFYYFTGSGPGMQDVNLGVILNPLIMLSFSVLIIISGLGSIRQ